MKAALIFLVCQLNFNTTTRHFIPGITSGQADNAFKLRCRALSREIMPTKNTQRILQVIDDCMKLQNELMDSVKDNLMTIHGYLSEKEELTRLSENIDENDPWFKKNQEAFGLLRESFEDLIFFIVFWDVTKKRMMHDEVLTQFRKNIIPSEFSHLFRDIERTVRRDVKDWIKNR